MKNEHTESPEITAILQAAKRIEQRRNKNFKIDQTRMEEFKSLLERGSLCVSPSNDLIEPVQMAILR